MRLVGTGCWATGMAVVLTAGIAQAQSREAQQSRGRLGQAQSDASRHDGLTLGDPDSGWSARLGAQLRPRVIVDTGKDFLSGSEIREGVTQRARVTLQAEHDSSVGILFQLQDVRTWGEESDTLGDFDADGLDVHQAYASLPLVRGLKLKLGRQEIVLDGSRLIGNVGWTQRARSFDAARLTLAGHSFDIDAFGARLSEDDANPDGNVPTGRLGDVSLVGAHASVEYWPGHRIAPLYVFKVDEALDHNRHTAGLTASGRMRGLHYSVEFFYQFGVMDTFDANGDSVANNASIGAYLFAGSTGYTFDGPYRPDVTVFAEMLSGDGTPEGAFDTLYATNHKFYGEMDFFLNVPLQTRNSGLLDIGAKLSSALLPDLNGSFALHHFRTQEAVANESILGSEFDFKLGYSPLPFVDIEAMVGLFLPGQAMRSILAIPDEEGLALESLAFVTTDVEF